MAPKNDATKLKVNPLRDIRLNTRPLVKRALTFSCDGELAVAADDSVHLFVPEFPHVARVKAARSARLALQATGNYVKEEEESDDEFNFGSQVKRSQYSEGSKHIPVSFPPLDPRVNKELFEAVGIPFPCEEAASERSEGLFLEGDEDGEEEVDEDDASESGSDDDEDIRRGSNAPFGAGYGSITGPGSSLNHVVHLVWSPTGLGMNQRPVLGVLTAAGVLAVYGDSSAAGNVLTRANEGMVQRRELNSWQILWGVGERLPVPGQQMEISENIHGFAWARYIAPGQSLLAYVNDLGEIAILSVQFVRTADIATGQGKDFTTRTGQQSCWLVSEIARFTAEGPHPKGNVFDPDYIPCGTSFGVQWSPWLQVDGLRVCVLSYVAPDYIGFRKVTLPTDWARGQPPEVEVDEADTYGICLHLSVDAFVEFEDAVRTTGNVKIFRGVASTGFRVRPFEVPIHAASTFHSDSHSVTECGTGMSEDGEEGRTDENPIVDLIIHPPELSRPRETPSYTLVRLSATHTTPKWYESNVVLARNPVGNVQPQWVDEISNKLDVAYSARMHASFGYRGSGGSGASEDDEDSDDDDAFDFDDEDEIPPDQLIHPHRIRIHGLTASAGGGVTAILTSQHSTQIMERGGFHTMRSTVHFAFKPEPDLTEDDGLGARSPHSPHSPANMSTEGQYFEWLYGGGQDVPGVTGPTSTQKTLRLREIFQPILAQQTCDTCESLLSRQKPNGRLRGCENGHWFGTCGTTGLAILLPGIARICGTCALRTIRGDVLVEKLPEKRDEIRREVDDGVCGSCGGKFLN